MPDAPMHWGAEALWQQLLPLLPGLSVEVVERIPLEVEPHAANIHYLRTKQEKLGHLFSALNLPR